VPAVLQKSFLLKQLANFKRALAQLEHGEHGEPRRTCLFEKPAYSSPESNVSSAGLQNFL